MLFRTADSSRKTTPISHWDLIGLTATLSFPGSHVKTLYRDPIVGAIETTTLSATLRQLISIALLGSHMGDFVATVHVEKQATLAKLYPVPLSAIIVGGLNKKKNKVY